MSKKSTSPSNKAYFTKYKVEGIVLKNASKKLERHLQKHPNDSQSLSLEPVNYSPKKKGA